MTEIQARRIEIRDCLETDMPFVTAIYAHHVETGTASFETEPPTLEEMCRRRHDIIAKGLPYLVAAAGPGILGYASAGQYRPRTAYRDTVENSIYLRPDSMSLGIGSRLLPALVRECELRDLRQIVAVVGDSANHASIRLHERCGFELMATLRSVGFKHGKWLDSVILQRSVGRADSTPPSRP